MGRDHSLDHVLSIAAAIGLDQKVMELTNAYQTILNPEASTLDRQLITLVILCRALVAAPSVLLWDTHTHYLSNSTLETVLKYLENNYKGTVLLASINEHNLSLNHEKLILC